MMKDYKLIILKQLLDAAQDGNISSCTWHRIINHGYCAYCDGAFGTDRCFYLANSIVSLMASFSARLYGKRSSRK